MEITFGIDLTFIFLGIVGGTIAGLMPGIAMAVLLLATYPFFISFDVFQIVQFYISAILISQFIGSIVATYFAIPGETSSIPAVAEGHKMALDGKTSQAIFISAIGSFIGGMVALFFLLIIWNYSNDIFKYITSFTNAIIIGFVFLLMFIAPCKNNFERLGFPIIGIVLGLIGESPLDYQKEFLTFDIDMLQSGIPSMPVMMGLYTLPLLIKLHKDNKRIKGKSIIPSFNIKEIYFDIKYFFISIGYAIWGFCFAFLPGIGLGIVSNISYQIQLLFNKKLKIKKESEYSLLAAETSNNSGAFSVMLPLLIFGIPTSTSQAILYDMLTDKGFVFSSANFTYEFVISLGILIVYTSVFGFLLACPLARLLGMFYGKFEKHLYILLSILIISVTLYLGYTTLDFILSLIILILGFIFAITFYNYNTLRIIYFFILTPFFAENWLRIGYHLGIL